MAKCARAVLACLCVMSSQARVIVHHQSQGSDFVRRDGPSLLAFDELETLSTMPNPTSPLSDRLYNLLNTPFISNEAYYDGARPGALSSPRLGPFLRVALWNIEQGNELDRIIPALSDPDRLWRMLEDHHSPGVRALTPAEKATINSQFAILHDADILILNEVDYGVTRSAYRDVARELAAALHMNYVFGVEFVEVDPLELGLEAPRIDDDPEALEEVRSTFVPDKSRYLGLHGTAILSRYPIRMASVRPMPLCYDWYTKEREKISVLEKGVRIGSEVAFLERITREVRRGARTTILADLAVPEAPNATVTIVAPHLENKCQPDCRRRQMDEVLTWIRDIDHPLILAGDLNTTGSDAAPTSIFKIVKDRVVDPEFWAKKAVTTVATAPVMAVVNPVRYARNYSDPTGLHVPVLGPKREAKLFRDVKAFRFNDGTAFDFRGTPAQTVAGKSGTLGDSNERAGKGFHYTFALQRNYGGVVGRYKLDWFFIKGFATKPDDRRQPLKWAPHFARTLQEMNDLGGDRLSDHAPMTVDLPFTEPPTGRGR